MVDNRNDYIPEEEYETGMVEETEGNDNPNEDCEDPFGAIQVVGDLEINDAREREENGFPVLEGDEYDEEEKTDMVSLNRPVLQTLDDFMEKVEKPNILRYVNEKIANGSFDRLLGTAVGGGLVTERGLKLKWSHYWQQNSTDIIADLEYSVLIKGKQYRIFVTIWCNMEGSFSCEIQDMGDINDRPDRTLTKLDRNMISILSNDEIETMAERIWDQYDRNALITGDGLNPLNLADKLHLTVVEYPLYKEHRIRSILFFEEDDIQVARYESHIKEDEDEDEDDDAYEEQEEDENGEPKYDIVSVPPDTIVVNRNCNDHDGHYLSMYHEIGHKIKDQAFFHLQRLINTDTGDIPRVKVKVEKKKSGPDGLALLEFYATRLAFALMLPRCILRDEVPELVEKFYEKNKFEYVNAGMVYEYVIWGLSKKYKVPACRVKTRLIQMGIVEANGARNWADGWIPAFGFSDYYKDVQHSTYVIDKKNVKKLYEKDKRFKKLMQSGDYAHVEGHVVLNHSSFIKTECGEAQLTLWARSHIDECCLRFSLNYINRSGRAAYRFGRLNCDEAYNRHYRHFIDRDGIMSDEEFQARKKELIDKLKSLSFPEALKELMNYGNDKSERFTVEGLEESSHVSCETIKNYINKKRCPKIFSRDIVVALCIGMHLPPYLSRVLAKKANIDVFDNDEEPQYEEVLTLRFMDTIDEVQEYLMTHYDKQLDYKDAVEKKTDE